MDRLEKLGIVEKGPNWLWFSSVACEAQTTESLQSSHRLLSVE